MIVRRAMPFAIALAGLFVAGCVPHASENAPAASTTAPQALATVAALPAPSATGPIASVHPTGDANQVAQVRVQFRDDIIPLGELETPSEQAVLAHFSLEPALGGRFRILTPRMVGFEADRAWPAATRVRVRIAKGLRSVHGLALDDDVSWTFTTAGIALSDLPAADSPVALSPQIGITSNVALDPSSLAAHASVRVKGARDGAIALTIAPDTATAAPSPANDEQNGDDSNRTWRYVLVPAAPLAKGTTYDVAFAPGIMPRDGNVASTAAFSGALVTYDGLRSTGSSFTTPGRFVRGDVLLTFSTPIDPASLSALTLSPAPPRGSTPFAVLDSGVVGVNSSLLRPNSPYTVSIGTALRDTFGQSLAKAATVTFRTDDLSPSVWAPSGSTVFASGKDVRLNVIAVNAPATRAVFTPLTARDVVLYPDPVGEPDRGDVLRPSANWPAFDVRAARDVERTIPIPLREKLHGPTGVLAYGVAAKLGVDNAFVAAGVVQLTNLGAFAQFFPDSGSVRVNRIADGTPVAGADVDVFPSQTAAPVKTALHACASAVTGTDGVARFGGSAFATCAALDHGDNEAPSFVTIVRQGSDWTYLRTDAYSGAYTGDFWNGWSSATPIARGTLFSDRQLYKPGETMHMTMVGWFLVDGTLRRGIAPSYALQEELPDGTKRDLGRTSLDAFGMSSVTVSVPANAPLGYYLIRAKAGNGEELTGDFRVAEFKAPTFKVDLALDRSVVQRGSTVAATASNAYLFGAPLAGASTKFTVTRSPAMFVPPGRDGFTFGRRWFWPDQQPDAATDVLQSTATVDAAGKSAVAVPVAGALPYAMTYEVDAETTDASNSAVSDTKTFTALPSSTLVGVRTDGVGNAGTPLAIGIVAAQPSGASAAATTVHVELQAAQFASATQIVEGAEQAVQSVSYKTVAAGDVTTSAGTATLSLTPPAGGEYRLRAMVGSDDATETDADVYVAGGGSDGWFTRDPSTLAVKLDRATYTAGDTATVLVQSPFPHADLHLSVVRHGVLWESTMPVSGSAATARIRITPDMLPNAAVQAFLVRRGPLPNSNLPDGGNALARTGFAAFSVTLAGKYVATTVRADGGVLAPGARQTVHFTLRDASHHPVRGGAALMVVNDAVLSLTGYRPPDLVKMVYADQPISTRFGDSRAALTLASPAAPLQKGWGFGGGLSDGDTDPRVRRAFKALAYFDGAIRTDAQGNASASFMLPDDLTTWRVMVVASTTDGRFGNGETTFRTTKPLVANPALPQFARPGDTFSGGVVVTNGTAASGTIDIAAVLAGPLAFVHGSSTSATTTLSTPLTASATAYRFPIVARGTGTATATVRVHGAAMSDAFAVPLDVRDLDVTEAVAQTGATQDRVSIPIDVARDTPADSGGLDISLAASLLPEITVAAQAALQGDERVTIASASRRIVAADLALLAAKTGADAAKARAAGAAQITALTGLRRGDGGFASFWQETRSEPWDSLVALEALSRAKAAGFPFDKSLLTGAMTYAAAVLADPAKHAPWCTPAECKARLRLFALTALAESGDRRTTFLSDINDERATLSVGDRVRLARLMTGAPAYAAAAAALSRTVDDEVAQSARGAVVNLPTRYRWYENPVVVQAGVLQLAMTRGADDDTIDRLTRSLLDLRRNGSFGCACENAAALDALVAVASRERPAHFTAQALLEAARFGPHGYALSPQPFTGPRSQFSGTLPMAKLGTGRADLSLAKTGTGTLHYAVTYRYRVAAPAPGRMSGLRVTRIVRAANTTAVLAQMGLVLPAASLELAAARVYDIEIDIVTDHPVDRVVIADPLPAGMEGVDTSFATTSAALSSPQTSWSIGDQQIRTDRIEAYADRLDAGIYRLHYLARTVTPGSFAWPGATARLVNAPEEFGRSAASVLIIR